MPKKKDLDYTLQYLCNLIAVDGDVCNFPATSLPALRKHRLIAHPAKEDIVKLFGYLTRENLTVDTVISRLENLQSALDAATSHSEELEAAIKTLRDSLNIPGNIPTDFIAHDRNISAMIALNLAHAWAANKGDEEREYIQNLGREIASRIKDVKP